MTRFDIEIKKIRNIDFFSIWSRPEKFSEQPWFSCGMEHTEFFGILDCLAGL
jgi:hypothetical protein